MIDINAEAEKSLLKTKYRIEYQYPKTWAELPTVSFYNLTEAPEFSTDNAEDIQQGTIQVDIWAAEPQDTGDMAVKINDVLTADGWYREMSRDIPPVDDVYHRTMRYTKDFII